MQMEQSLKDALDHARSSERLVVVLTGAGISAESGIPTFRGKDGYWTVGSKVYQPQELATAAAFARLPAEVWQWYLYRRTICRRAEPNAAHRALVDLERALGSRFRLITQNVDGLHLRAGHSHERSFEIHGNIDFMRCARECDPALVPIPEQIGAVEADQALTGEQLALLSCPRCGGRARPHVLWFDESYDEPRYRFESSLAASSEAALIVVVGTSASTTLPWYVVRTGAQLGAAIVDVNIADNDFGEIAKTLPLGHVMRAPAARAIPRIVDYLVA